MLPGLPLLIIWIHIHGRGQTRNDNSGCDFDVRWRLYTVYVNGCGHPKGATEGYSPWREQELRVALQRTSRYCPSITINQYVSESTILRMATMRG